VPSAPPAAGLFALLCLGCAVEPPSQPAQPDASPPADAAPGAPDATPLCDNAETPTAYHHDPGYEYGNGGIDGAGCLGQCHQGVGTGPTFTIGGSLWNRRLAGGDPIAGGIVYVIDGSGKVIKMVTNEAGHFWYRGAVTQPLRAYATGCPDTLAMEANTTGNCTAGACHGSNNKIYLTNVDPPLPP
jgi:hypothetical protein